MHRTLTQLGIIHQFDVMIGGEDYTHGKPDPEPFCWPRAACMCRPRSLVFEDADAGIQAAEAAAMQWVRVPQNLSAASLGHSRAPLHGGLRSGQYGLPR